MIRTKAGGSEVEIVGGDIRKGKVVYVRQGTKFDGKVMDLIATDGVAEIDAAIRKANAKDEI